MLKSCSPSLPPSHHQLLRHKPTMAVRCAMMMAGPARMGRLLRPSLAALPSVARFASLSSEGQSILDHLLKIELDAEGYYKEMAAKAKNDGFRTIFSMLANEEAKHTEWVKHLAQSGELSPAVQLNRSLLVCRSSEDTTALVFCPYYTQWRSSSAATPHPHPHPGAAPSRTSILYPLYLAVFLFVVLRCQRCGALLSPCPLLFV